MYYMKFARRNGDGFLYPVFLYFNSEEAMKVYEEKFKKYLYDEDRYFITESGEAYFNDAGVLMPS